MLDNTARSTIKTNPTARQTCAGSYQTSSNKGNKMAQKHNDAVTPDWVAQPKSIPMTTQRGCMDFVLDRRLSCRRIIQQLDAVHADNHNARRWARKLRESKHPMLARRAQTLETEASRRSESMQAWRDMLLDIGRELMEKARWIDAAVPQPVLLDLLNVNQSDRGLVSPDDGVIELAYTKSLEDSAMHRGSDWKQGPLARAVTHFMSHELMHNKQLQEAAHAHLFGKGGIFEFLPTYRQTSNGEMVRMPPKLRLAEACDASQKSTGERA